MLGGAAAATEDLDEFFAELNAGPRSRHAFLGNEPSALTPWIYNWLGRPDKGQAVVRNAILTLFGDSPTGYPGNEDVGQMSAWYVFGALGLYPAIPGVDALALGSPLFRRTVLRLPGRTIILHAPNADRDHLYVRGLESNGSPYTKTWISAADLGDGATLTYDLSPIPTGSWGTACADAPPSFSPDAPEPRCPASSS